MFSRLAFNGPPWAKMSDAAEPWDGISSLPQTFNPSRRTAANVRADGPVLSGLYIPLECAKAPSQTEGRVGSPRPTQYVRTVEDIINPRAGRVTHGLDPAADGQAAMNLILSIIGLLVIYRLIVLVFWVFCWLARRHPARAGGDFALAQACATVQCDPVSIPHR